MFQRCIERKVKRHLIITTSVPAEWRSYLERYGIIALGRIPQSDYYALLKRADIAFQALTSAFKLQNVLVFTMEAWAAGKPVVSPAIRYYPDVDKISRLGILTSWVDNLEAAKSFCNSLIYATEKIDEFNSNFIRNETRKYYSKEAFLADFKEAVETLSE